MTKRRPTPPRGRRPGRPWAGAAALLLLVMTAVLTAPSAPLPQHKSLAALRQIREEVKEMGPYPGESFIRREFFVGEDDDDTNKDIHVCVLIQSSESEETMTIRVTEMARDSGNPHARLAKESKILVCRLAGDRVEVRSSDYKEKDLTQLAAEILTAIRNKKRLLKTGN